MKLTVGKEVMIPEVVEESEEKQKEEANSVPTTDVQPQGNKETKDKQGHESKKKEGSKVFSYWLFSPYNPYLCIFFHIGFLLRITPICVFFHIGYLLRITPYLICVMSLFCGPSFCNQVFVTQFS